MLLRGLCSGEADGDLEVKLFLPVGYQFKSIPELKYIYFLLKTDVLQSCDHSFSYREGQPSVQGKGNEVITLTLCSVHSNCCPCIG